MDRASHGGFKALLTLTALLVVLTVSGLPVLQFQLLRPTLAHARAHAQDEEPWSPPVNLSVSGSASRPAVALAPNGFAHALWWDSVDGSRYARGSITGTQMLWSRPQPVPFLVGDRATDPSTRKVLLSEPSALRMLADRLGTVHATWIDADRQLHYAQLPRNGRWSERPKLTDRVLDSSMALDVSGTLRLAFVQSSQTSNSLAGVYYGQPTGGAIRRTLVYSSTYFRTAEPDNVNIGVAADSKGNVIVTWRQSPEDQAQFTRSTNNGAKWNPPEPITAVSELFGLATQVSVASSPTGEFLLVWRDSSAAGCGLTQRRSTDGGQTWSPPERVLTELVRCPNEWSFSAGADGKLWFIGAPSSDSPLSDTNGTLAAWDGVGWSKPADVQIVYRDTATQRTRVLGCLNIALNVANVMVIGCDARGDVWTSLNQIPLEQLLPTTQQVWNSPVNLSRTEDPGSSDASLTETTQSIAVAADEQGKLFALWSRAESPALPPTRLDISTFDGTRFLAPATILTAEGSNANAANDDAKPVRMDAPSLTIDNNNEQRRVHLVWSGGSAGRPFYSRAYARDAASPSGWSRPIPLPARTPLGASPQIMADPRGNVLYVIYTIPFNEQRGVYLIRSDDLGDTWSEPLLVASGAERNWYAVDQPQLALDPQANVLHVTWLQTNSSGATGTRAVYYARSADDGKTWSEPLQLAQGVADAPRVAVMARDLVALTWNLARDAMGEPQATDAWYQISNDGGAQWTEANLVPGFEGITGGATLVSDGASQLYLAALSYGSGGQTQLLFTQWQGQVWSKADQLNLGQPAMAGNAVAGKLIAPSGSLQLLLRLFQLKPNGAGVWESIAISRTVTPVQLTPLATFTPRVLPTQTPVPTVPSTPTPEPEAVSTISPRAGSDMSDSNNILLLSIGIAVVVIVAGAVIGTVLHRIRR